MGRFDDEGLRRFSARDAVLAVGLTTLLLILFAGGAVRKQGEEMRPGIGRDIVLAFGKPAGWLSDRLPLADAADSALAWLSPDESLDENDSFAAAGANDASQTITPSDFPPVTADAFDPVQLGEKPPPKRKLGTLLVTGDSLVQPLDLEIARRLASGDSEVIRDAHVGTGLSNPVLVDWGQLSAQQVRDDHPDAVVVFIGANEGYPLPGPGSKDLSCCGPEWAAALANRARQMMSSYRQGGAAKVYWLTVPTPRDPARQRIERVVNQAISVAAEPWRSQIRVIDTVPVFAPGDRYRDAMEIDGKDTIVRESDGIHLNEAGSALAAEVVLDALGRDFTY